MQESEEMEAMRECGYTPIKSVTRLHINGEFMNIQSNASGKKYGARVFYEMDFDEMRDVNVAFSVEHPNVLHAIRMFTPRMCEALYGMFSYLTEPPVATLAERKGGLDLKGRMSALLDVCDGVKYLHSVGIVHRDIRPESILLYSDRAVIGFSELSMYMHEGSCISTLDPGFYPPPETSLKDKSGSYPEPFESGEVTDGWAMGLLAAYMFSDDGLHCLAPFREDGQTGNINFELSQQLKDDYTRQEIVKDVMKQRPKGMSDELLNDMVELVSSALDPDPAYRVDVDVISRELREIATKHNIATPRTEKKGRLVPPVVKAISIPKFAVSIVVDCLSTKVPKHTTLEQAFLMVDIYYRAVPYYEPLTGKDDYDRKNYMLLFFVSLMMAEHLAPGERHVTVEDITSFTGVKLDKPLERLIEKTRDAIAEMFGGILYRRHLFHASRSFGTLRSAFSELENPDYLLLDLGKWLSVHGSDIPSNVPGTKSAILLREFASKNLQ